MIDIRVVCLKALRKVYLKTSQHFLPQLSKTEGDVLYEKDCEYFDQDANNFIANRLRSSNPCMISKFGTIELSALVQYRSLTQHSHSLKDCIDFVMARRSALWWKTGIDALCSNAGFFPNRQELLEKFYKINLDAMKHIDILGSYVREERIFSDILKGAAKVNLNGYYAPFLFKSPWTSILRGKRVLVIHPFSVSIEHQYEKRKLLWEDSDVLPDFELITLKAPQTMLGQASEFETWFHALESMKANMRSIEYDIALIGCGAYGMPLAAEAKLQGKHAVHLAGWTQVLFGIRGKRWEEIPWVAKFMNQYWVHPLPEEIPSNFRKVENGCYW